MKKITSKFPGKKILVAEELVKLGAVPAKPEVEEAAVEETPVSAEKAPAEEASSEEGAE